VQTRDEEKEDKEGEENFPLYTNTIGNGKQTSNCKNYFKSGLFRA